MISEPAALAPSAKQAFAQDLQKLSVRLPLRPMEDHCGTVVDADGVPVFVVDHNRERPDMDVERIALWIILAVNTCGGFKLDSTR
tara:strand:+ start:231 stop:485 length:255 start_codon:yes stop_codon:yes gene_type:complete